MLKDRQKFKDNIRTEGKMAEKIIICQISLTAVLKSP